MTADNIDQYYHTQDSIKAGRSKLARPIRTTLWDVEDSIDQYYHTLGINAKSDHVDRDKQRLIKALQTALKKLKQ